MENVQKVTPALDFFHPGYSGWQDYENGVPEALRMALPQLDFGDGLTIKTQTLPFYPDCAFLMFKNPSWVPSNLYIYALKKGEDVVWLNGTSPGIHQFNGAGNIALTDENALQYLHFFCFFVRGKEGPFYVVNSLDAPYLISQLGAGANNDKNLRAMFEARYQSPRGFGTTPDGNRRYSLLVMYSNAFFIADFELKPSGMVEMRDDTPIMSDLPAKIDAPLTPLETSGDGST